MQPEPSDLVRHAGKARSKRSRLGPGRGPGARVDLLVDLGDLFHPAVPLGMRKVQDLIPRPMKMIRDKTYLLEEPIQGVGRYSPKVPRSKSNSCWQCGQRAFTMLVPSSLTRR